MNDKIKPAKGTWEQIQDEFKIPANENLYTFMQRYDLSNKLNDIKFRVSDEEYKRIEQMIRSSDLDNLIVAEELIKIKQTKGG